MKTNDFIQTHPISTEGILSVRSILLICGAALLTGLASHIRIPLPFSPVPITLQTSAVIFVGGFLGPRRAILSQLVMLVAGALGAPFFATGPAALWGATGGYLFGFILLAWASGQFYSKSDSFRDSYFKLFLASLIVFVPGVIWLKIFTAVSWMQALQMGLIPFIAGDIAKTGISVAALRLTHLKKG